MIKVLVVDDERHARQNVTNRLLRFSESMQVVGEAANVNQARLKVKELNPDLVFLDIEMPGDSGFELLEGYEEYPFDVIFVTAYQEYALKAFEHFAIGYIMKPIDDEMFVKAIYNYLSKAHLKLSPSLVKSITAYNPDQGQEKITIPTESGYHLINISDIVVLYSEDGYVHIMLENGDTIVSSKRLKYYEEKLYKTSCIRIHRSFIVNKSKVLSFGKDGIVTMSNQLEIPINKNNRRSVTNLLFDDI